MYMFHISMKITFSILAFLFISGIDSKYVETGRNGCPYAKPNVSFKNEVFAFMTTSDMTLWDKLPWNVLTTLGLFMDPIPQKLICLAHMHQVRVIKAVDFKASMLSNVTAQAEFIKENVEYIKNTDLDGINVDFEVSMSSSGPGKQELTNFMANLGAALHTSVPNSKLSFDVPYSPDGIYGRNYDVVAMAQHMDYLVVMCYDEASGPYANSNSGYSRTAYGAQRYLDVGVPESKLILAFPWYGYAYKCSSISKNHVCSTDSGSEEIIYTKMEAYFKEHSISGRLWDKTAMSPYFDYEENGQKGQVRYDDPRSLRLKNDIALRLNLLGVGMWTANYGDFNDTNRWNDMWSTMPYSKSQVL